jgi:cbb3-type cytochrome oxidase maturation protein
MNSLLFLVPLSLLLLVVAILAFRWAVRGGQFENLDTPALDILRDDEDDDAGRPDAD